MMNVLPISEIHYTQIRDIILQHIMEAGIQPHDDHGSRIIGQLVSAGNRSGSFILVSESEGTVTGYINCHLCGFPLLGGSECYVTELFVRAEYRGQAAGRTLLAAAEKKARDAGAARMILNNHTESESYSSGFYAKNGFSERTAFANFTKDLI
jgi:GNAT superfamily N-acetyltransferase